MQLARFTKHKIRNNSATKYEAWKSISVVFMPCAQVRREKIFKKKLGEPPPEQTKKKIDDDSLVFCIFLPHTPPFSLYL
jgi:hypothetical protein